LVLVLFLESVWRIHSGLPHMPTWWWNKKIFMDAFIVLTHNYTSPAIMKKYVNVSAFSNVCACNGTDGMFDNLDVVYIPNENAKHVVFHGMWPPSLTAGADYWDKHVCKKENSYIFYEREPLKKRYPDLQGNMDRWFNKIEDVLKLSPRIKDSRFDEDWFQELFLGYADKPLQSWTKSGSGMHQGDVHNYYVQICGSKRWIVGKDSVRFNNELDIPYSGQFVDVENLKEFLNRSDVLVGWTYPGDMLLNPVWLWHLVQTDMGSNFGITYKISGNTIRRIAPDHIRPRLPKDELFMGEVRHWLLFVRGRISRLLFKHRLVIVVIMTFVCSIGVLGTGLVLFRRHQKTS